MESEIAHLSFNKVVYKGAPVHDWLVYRAALFDIQLRDRCGVPSTDYALDETILICYVCNYVAAVALCKLSLAMDQGHPTFG